MNCFNLHKISDSTLKLFKILSELAMEKNVEIYVVGGFVRDLLLKHEVEDIDVVVEGDAIDFAFAFKKTHGGSKVVSYGRFGTAMLNYKNLKLEFATAREEYYDPDSRKPHVSITNIQTDLSRRDFTINAMAVSLNEESWGELIDPFNGRQDLNTKIIKTPLEAEITYYDDPLRMLRAVRFASRLNFVIEEASLTAIKKIGARMEIISRERVTDEFQKMLMHKKPSLAIDLLVETGLLPIILPELYKLNEIEVFKTNLLNISKRGVDFAALRGCNDFIIRMAVLFAFIGIENQRQIEIETINNTGRNAFIKIGKSMKLPVKVFEIIAKIIQYQNIMRKMIFTPDEYSLPELRKFLIEIGTEFEMTLSAAEAIHNAIEPLKDSDKAIAEFIKLVKKQEKIENWRDFKLSISGNEIMEILNIKEGIGVGNAKNELTEQIINGNIKNNKEECFAYLKREKVATDLR